MKQITRYLTAAAAVLLTGTVLYAQDFGTAAISQASGDELYKSVNENLTNTFEGAFSGLTVLQGTGELGNDSARWLIRGMGSYGVGTWSMSKFFVDGFEVNSEYIRAISPTEIEKVEVLKDAAALAMYGERGGNGVIRITTRRGKVGKPTINARVRYGVQTPQLLNKPLDAAGYASLYNQAVSNDNGMVWSPAYTQQQIADYRSGAAPNVDWYAQTMRKAASFVDADVILNGGSENARYNINLDYLGNQGLLGVKNTDATKNLTYNRVNLRANLDFKVLKIFEVRFDMGGRLEFLDRPNYGISSLFQDLQRYPSNIYNVWDDDQKQNLSGNPVFPNNPYGSVNAMGWYSYKGRSLQTNLEVRERLDMVTPGFFLEQAISFYSYTVSTYAKTRNYARYSDGATTTTDETTTLTASGYGSGGMQDWKQGRITAGYDRSFGEHNVSARINGGLSAYKGDGYFSYKYNTLNVSGLFHYDYAHRYIVEAAFSEFGNDAYAKGNRWAFYPTLSAAWVLSNEAFMKDSAFELLKLRASAGLSGVSDSNATGVLSSYGSNGRYLFKDYYTYSYIGSFYTGSDPQWQNSLVQMFVPNEKVHAEKSLKLNVGVDMRVAGLSLSADAFLDKRSDILTLDSTNPAYLGKQYSFANIGKMTNYGFELEALWQTRLGADAGLALNGSLAYAHNKIDYMAEVPTAHPYNAKTGRPYGTYIGLVADGFYGTDDFDDNGNLVAGLPVPAFGSVQPGDIKYRDLDGDKVVDDNDITRIGRSWIPEWTFSFGAKFCWKGLDVSLQFGGVAGVSANLLDNSNQMVAFVNNGNAYPIHKGAWAYYPTEGIDTRATATYPRLTTRSNENNYRTSSFWIKDASFLKLRNVEIGYNFDGPKLQKAGIAGLRCFISGQNLFTVSPLQKQYNLDPEHLSGLYPALRTFNAGVSITF